MDHSYYSLLREIDLFQFNSLAVMQEVLYLPCIMIDSRFIHDLIPIVQITIQLLQKINRSVYKIYKYIFDTKLIQTRT